MTVDFRQSQKRPFCWMELSARESLTCALPRMRNEPTSYGVTDTIFFGGTMTKRNRAFFEEGTLEACLRNQDDEFYRRLRIAVETGMESCPTTVITEPCTKRPISNYARPN